MKSLVGPRPQNLPAGRHGPKSGLLTLDPLFPTIPALGIIITNYCYYGMCVGEREQWKQGWQSKYINHRLVLSLCSQVPGDGQSF